MLGKATARETPTADPAEQNFDPEVYTAKEEKPGKERLSWQLGVLLASGYGAVADNSDSGSGLTRGGGISTDLKLSRRFTISSGLVVTSQNLESNKNLPTLLSGDLRRSEATNTNTMNLDMPVNLRYILPTQKNNFFVSVGLSNFVRLNQKSTIESTVEREITVVREVNGMETLTTTVETLTSTSSEKNRDTEFLPASMFNFSVGFSKELSPQLLLEAAPFYQYPLRGLTADGARFSVLGLRVGVTLPGEGKLKRQKKR